MESNLNAIPTAERILMPAPLSRPRQHLFTDPLSLTPCFSGVLWVLTVKQTVSTVYYVQSKLLKQFQARANTPLKRGVNQSRFVVAPQDGRNLRASGWFLTVLNLDDCT